MSRLIDLIGQKFGRLIVIKRVNNNQRGTSRWLCRCDCGVEKIIRGDLLKNGDTKSCGCLHIEVAKINCDRTIHGHRRNRQQSGVYISWISMIQRCINFNNTYYKNYGGRGITVCKYWRNSFSNFLEDMGEPPTKNHTLDRISNNRGYCKSNCRWATRKQQARNRKNNRQLSHNGKTQCVATWAEESGISYNTLYARIYRYNWSIKKAITTPLKHRRNGS